ncbi:histidine kinase [Bifidobacterium simiarum]
MCRRGDRPADQTVPAHPDQVIAHPGRTAVAVESSPRRNASLAGFHYAVRVRTIGGNAIGSLAAWTKRHVMVGDTLLALFLTLLCSMMAGGTILDDGLIIPSGNPTPMIMTDAQYAWFSGFWTWSFAVPMMFRRRFPRASAMAFVALCLLQMLAGPSIVYGDVFALFHLYTVIVVCERRQARGFIAVAAGMDMIASAVNAIAAGFGSLAVDPATRIATGSAPCLAYDGGIDWSPCGDVLTGQLAAFCPMVFAPTLATIVMAYWQKARLRTVRLMRERNAALAARREEESRIAALAERARIARDMHDVVAHTLSTIIVQADGGRFAGAHDIDLARSTMTTIGRESNRALHDMRRLLGSLEDPDAPTYENIDALVRQAQGASPTWRLTRTVSGVPRPDDLGVNGSATVYHMVQEALTNIRKYAGPDVTVRIDETWDDAGVRIGVTDDGRGASAASDGHKPGYGLIGMRERLDALGGTLHAGPRLGGGFEVTGRVPFVSTRADRRESPSPIAADTHRERTAYATGSDDTAAAQTQSRQTQSPQATQSPQTAQSPRTAESASAAGSVTARGFRQLVIETLGRIRSSFRSQRRDGDRPADDGSNPVERLSRWTERHYTVVDAVYALLLLLLANSGAVSTVSEYSAFQQTLLMLADVAATAPLIWRRRFPQASAFTFGLVMIMESWLLPWLSPLAMVTVFSLYSVSLYASRRAIVWVAPMVLFGTLTVAFKMTLMTDGINYPLQGLAMLAGHSPDPATSLSMSRNAFLMEFCVYVALIVLICLGALAAGRWSRSRESNLLVLQARQDALREEEAKQKILAANMERNRISANIQSEVTDTLRAVSGKTESGLRMLDEDPSPERIAKAFEDIAAEGRAALKHMRQLLGVLRETGFSDDRANVAAMTMPLSPAAPMDRQRLGSKSPHGTRETPTGESTDRDAD